MADIKAERFGECSIDELCYTRDEAAEFCRLVKERLRAPRLTRPFILRNLAGIRKNGGARRKPVASLADGQAAP